MMLNDEEKTNWLVSSVQKENLLKHEKFLNYLKEGNSILNCNV